MQISMEILSNISPRADSGKDAREKAKSVSTDFRSFRKTLENTRPVYEPVTKTEESNTSEFAINEDKTQSIPRKAEDKDSVDTELAAGVIGNQNMVVFILEGDKESATEPEICIDEAAVTEIIPETVILPDDALKAASGTDTGNAKPEPAVKETETEPEEIKAYSAETAVNRTETTKPEDGEARGVIAEATKTDAPQAKTETDTVNDTAGKTGEVLARTPETRTSDNQENTENNTGYSENGDLSPLENKNDTAPVKGQKEKTYTETADVVKTKAESTQEPVNNVPMPLTDGIKPERFQADQQMKQATNNAPVRAENLFDEMVSRLETVQTDSKTAMTIQLKPEFLGKVALEIAMDAAGLHVKINAADNSVRSMINGQINALIETLENKGIAVVEVEVAYTGVNNGAFKDSREGQAQPEHSRRSYRNADLIDSAAYYAALPYDVLDYYLEEGVSSVEYRA